jgi:hypothetical protein
MAAIPGPLFGEFRPPARANRSRFIDDARKEPNAVLNMTQSDHAQDCHGGVIGLAAA